MRQKIETQLRSYRTHVCPTQIAEELNRCNETAAINGTNFTVYNQV